MYWQDTILWEVQDLIDILKENKVIRRDTDYKRKHVRYIIDRPLYVKEVVDDLTDEFKKLWKLKARSILRKYDEEIIDACIQDYRQIQ